MIIQAGFREEDKDTAAALYWEAFGEKLGFAMGPKPKGIAFTRSVIRADHGISATSDEGALLGIVGFKTTKGALVDGNFTDLRAVYGFFGAIWRTAILSLLERDEENKRFLMDGIFVTEAARGQGVGQALLTAVCNEAHQRGYKEIRLDVIDTNPRARALYERFDFHAEKTMQLGPLRHFFGFSAATTMVKALNSNSETCEN